MTKKTAIACILVLLCLCVCSSALAGQQLKLITAAQNKGTLTLYALLTDDETDAIVTSNPSKENVKVSLNTREVAPADVATFSNTNEPVAYVLMIDLNSNALSASRGLASLKEGAMELVNTLRTGDLVKVVTVGKAVTTLVDFTSDRSRLVGAIDGLSSSNRSNKPMLLEGVSKAIESFNVVSDAFPTRHVIVLFTFGVNGSTYTAEEVRDRAADSDATLYAVGLKGEKSEPQLTDVGTIARASRGMLLDYKKFTPKEAVARIRDFVLGTYVITVKPGADAYAAGGATLGLSVDFGGAVIKSNDLSCELIPTPTPVATSTPTPTVAPTRASDADASLVSNEPIASPTKDSADDGLFSNPLYIVLIGAAALLIILLCVVLILRKRSRVKEQPEDDLPPELGFSQPPITPSDESTATGFYPDDESTIGMFSEDPEKTIEADRGGLRIRFHISGDDGNSDAVASVSSTLLIGRSDECGLHLNDKSVSRRHCELSLKPDGLYVNDLGSRSGTLLNSSPVLAPMPVRNGDRLTLGMTTITVEILA